MLVPKELSERRAGRLAGLYCPSGAIVASQVLGCVGDIGDLSALAVVQNLLPLPRTQRDDTQQHGLGELGRILDRGARLRLASDRLGPVELMTPHDSRDALGYGGRRLTQRLRIQPRI